LENPKTIIACVRTGSKYPVAYVHRLRAMVRRYFVHAHRFVVLTDKPNELAGYETVAIGDHRLIGWWGKMKLFDTSWRAGARVIYFDLDTVVIGDITPLERTADKDGFAICGNFTRAAGHASYPCRYGSCVMTMGRNFGDDVWRGFEPDAQEWMRRCAQYGDQRVIELLHPRATLLQDVTPPGFFMSYRDLDLHPDRAPRGCSVIAFGGMRKPDNCDVSWVKQAWAA
jgi:hypothetical protein